MAGRVDRVMVSSVLVGLGIALLHGLVHRGFIPLTDFVSTGSLQATVLLGGTLGLGIFISWVAALRLSLWRGRLVAFVAWFMHAVVHDGTHLAYVSFDVVSSFGEIGVPESGITVAVLYGVAILVVRRYSLQ